MDIKKTTIIILIVSISLVIAAVFWYKSYLHKQNQKQNQPLLANKISAMILKSPVFQEGEIIPAKYACDGLNISPPLEIADVPENAKSLALIMDDPDASSGTWVHWLIWNFSPETKEIAEDSIPQCAILGKNSSNKLAYVGPCPPSGTHRYFFKLYALDSALNIHEGSEIDDLTEAMEGHVLEQVNLMGKYSR